MVTKEIEERFENNIPFIAHSKIILHPRYYLLNISNLATSKAIMEGNKPLLMAHRPVRPSLCRSHPGFLPQNQTVSAAETH